MKRFLIILCMALFFLPESYALEIEGYDGTFIHDSVVTIRGNGFGVKPNNTETLTAAPLKWETFENGNAGEYVTTTNYWSKRSISGAIFDNTKNRSHSDVNVKVSFKPNEGVDGWFYRNNIGFAKTGVAYVNLWIYCDLTEGDSSWQLKLWRLNSDGNDHGSTPAIINQAWLNGQYPSSQYRNYYEIRSVPTGQNSAALTFNDMLVEGFWYNCSIAWKASSVDRSDGEVHIWTSQTPSNNGTIIHKYDGGVNTRTTEDNRHLDAIALGYLIENGGIESVTYWDNIYMDNTWARVEIGDRQDYDSCTHREIQIPITWSRIRNPYQKIDIRVNQGSFPSGPAYLFVVTEDGTPSKGFPISF